MLNRYLTRLPNFDLVLGMLLTAGMLFPALLISPCPAFALSSALPAQQQATPPREHFQNVEVIYDWVTSKRGDKLRTFITRPKNARGKVPAIFFVGWLSCDSMEYPQGETDGFGALMLRLIDQSGYATIRMNKPGVGESGGHCEKTDFQSELEGWQAAFDSLSKYSFIDLDRVFVLGLSNGGGFSPLVARQHPVRGFIPTSSWGRTWYEHMLELERRRLISPAHSPAEVNRSVKAFTEFYDLYLVQRMTPGEILRKHSEWKDVWYDAPDGQYGRPAAFYQQLQDLNLGEVWEKVNVSVLVIYGNGDTIMSHADAHAISETVNRVHPDRARFWEIDAMDHLLTVNGKFYDALVPQILDWIKEQLKNGSEQEFVETQ
jgi:pimeloyl-ACP methyl ester carboxylesterase